MDYEYEVDGRCCFRNMFRSFVCVALSALLGIHGYAYLWGPQDSADSFGEVKYVVMQLTRGLSEVNLKHARLKNEIDRISAVIPALAASADRAKDAIEPMRRNARSIMDVRDYDRQMTDFALESAGGRVVDTGNTIEYTVYESPVGWVLHSLTTLLCRECQGARAIINPGSLPGECWAFKGSRGEVTIRLAGPVRVTAFSVEHIPPHISPTKEISSAPKLFQLEGLQIRGDPRPHIFGSYEYDKDSKPIQYYEVLHPSPKSYKYVKFRVLNNWGHRQYTCVYRVRVHGELEVGCPHKGGCGDEELQIENEAPILPQLIKVQTKFVVKNKST